MVSSLVGFAGPTPSDPSGFFTRLRDGQKQTVVLYGTSLTKYGTWTGMLENWFEKKFPGQVTVINSGGPGQNSTWGLAEVKPQVLEHNPDLVFIEFGTNDAHTRFNLPVATARENLEKIIAAIQQQNPNAAIVLQTMNAFWDSTNPNGFAAADSSRPKLEDYYQNYRSCAREHGFALIDNYPDWLRLKKEHPEEFQKFLPDGTHPNNDGIQTVMWPNVERFLEQCTR